MSTSRESPCISLEAFSIWRGFCMSGRKLLDPSSYLVNVLSGLDVTPALTGDKKDWNLNLITWVWLFGARIAQSVWWLGQKRNHSSVPCKQKRFFCTSEGPEWLWALPSLLSSWYLGLLPHCKAATMWNHLALSSSKFKNLHSPVCLYGVHKYNITFLFIHLGLVLIFTSLYPLYFCNMLLSPRVLYPYFYINIVSSVS